MVVPELDHTDERRDDAELHRAPAWRRLALVGALAAAVHQACALNPQPIPPDELDGTANDAGGGRGASSSGFSPPSASTDAGGSSSGGGASSSGSSGSSGAFSDSGADEDGGDPDAGDAGEQDAGSEADAGDGG